MVRPNVGQVERNGVGQRLLHFANGAQQRFLEARAAVLLERFFRYHQRKEFAFGDLDGGERADLFGVIPAFPALVEGQRQLQPVAHKLEVAVDRFGADLQLLRQGGGIGIGSGLNDLMNPQHPLEGRAGTLVVAVKGTGGHEALDSVERPDL